MSSRTRRRLQTDRGAPLDGDDEIAELPGSRSLGRAAPRGRSSRARRASTRSATIATDGADTPAEPDEEFTPVQTRSSSTRRRRSRISSTEDEGVLETVRKAMSANRERSGNRFGDAAPPPLHGDMGTPPVESLVDFSRRRRATPTPALGTLIQDQVDPDVSIPASQARGLPAWMIVALVLVVGLLWQQHLSLATQVRQLGGGARAGHTIAPVEAALDRLAKFGQSLDEQLARMDSSVGGAGDHDDGQGAEPAAAASGVAVEHARHVAASVASMVAKALEASDLAKSVDELRQLVDDSHKTTQAAAEAASASKARAEALADDCDAGALRELAVVFPATEEGLKVTARVAPSGFSTDGLVDASGIVRLDLGGAAVQQLEISWTDDGTPAPVCIDNMWSR
ncbi:hypothetical protein FNF28_03907 [Cafeteria roenbergensis]|uniref:Uncharacterized protein n=1 Tax=Cafeteria roenbergensis TaxID=33653 RepID=A0A5A8DIB4_CAFRO|nr:hypothetical protein FNF28_03907 [Cafeteria roenbergensis]